MQVCLQRRSLCCGNSGRFEHQRPRTLLLAGTLPALQSKHNRRMWRESPERGRGARRHHRPRGGCSHCTAAKMPESAGPGGLRTPSLIPRYPLRHSDGIAGARSATYTSPPPHLTPHPSPTPHHHYDAPLSHPSSFYMFIILRLPPLLRGVLAYVSRSVRSCEAPVAYTENGAGGGARGGLSKEGFSRKSPPVLPRVTVDSVCAMDSATCIPSRVLHLPAPLLQSRPSRWASVQPSPDRASLLLRGRHECQLLAVSSTARQVPCVAVLAQSSSSSRGDDTRRLVARQRNMRGAGPDNAPSRGRPRCIVLPQPHRKLTSSCWLSADLVTCDDNGEAAASEGVVPGAVVGLGDADSVVTIMRPSPLSRGPSPGTTSTWLQATIFITDEEDAVLGCGTPWALHHQHHNHRDRLYKAAAFGQSCDSARAPPLSPTWKAVQTILPCSYVPSHSNGGLTDMYVVCQRADDVYVGSGVAAEGRAARRPCSSVWLASVQRESAWRVPLATPPGDDEDVMGSIGDGTAAHFSADVEYAVRRTPRLFDVRRRLPPTFKHTSARQCASSSATGPVGLVFAAAFRRHVGLYTARTVTPTVFFQLPSWLSGSGAATSSHSCCVTSVVEEPTMAAAAAVPQTSSIGSGSGCSYLVTVMHSKQGSRRSCPYSDHAKGAHGDESWLGDGDDNNNGGSCSSCWWLLYDSRNPSLPVWAAEEALAEPPLIGEDDVWRDAPVVTEWLSSTSPSPTSHAGLRSSPVCATYIPPATTSADDWSVHAALPARGICVVLDGGARMPDGVGLNAEDDDDVEGGEATEVFAPITYELSPPRSLRSPAPGAPQTVAAKPPQVRALTFTDGVLHYACEEVV